MINHHTSGSPRCANSVLSGFTVQLLLRTLEYPVKVVLLRKFNIEGETRSFYPLIKVR